MGHTNGSVTSQDAIHPEVPELPFAVKVLVCFMAVDALQRAVELAFVLRNSGAPAGLTPSPAQQVYLSALMVFLELTLVILLLLRTAWGRMWTQAVFVIHIAVVIQAIAITTPNVWVYTTAAERVRLACTLVIDAAAICYLFTGQARAALSG